MGHSQSSDSNESSGSLNLPNHPFPLEIGCGDRPTPGFIHNDMRPLDDVEIVADARDLLSILGPGRASQIRACHVLEHFPYPQTVNILSDWARLLSDNGSIHLEVPNLRWQISAVASGEITVSKFVYYAYGEQDYEGNFHYAAFDEDLLRSSLSLAGFDKIVISDIGQVLIATAFVSKEG